MKGNLYTDGENDIQNSDILISILLFKKPKMIGLLLGVYHFYYIFDILTPYLGQFNPKTITRDSHTSI